MNIVYDCALALFIAGVILLGLIIRHDNGTKD